MPTLASRQVPLLAALCALAVSAACAHATPPETAARPPAPPAQLAAVQSQPAASQPAATDLASGQAELDQALAKLRGVTVFFSFDEAALTPEAEEKLAAIGDLLRKYPKLSVQIEGNCDERGTGAYNLALGQRRAEAAKRYVVQMGASASQVSALSYGSEKPKATGHDEAAWSQNRRDDVVAR